MGFEIGWLHHQWHISGSSAGATRQAWKGQTRNNTDKVNDFLHGKASFETECGWLRYWCTQFPVRRSSCLPGGEMPMPVGLFVHTVKHLYMVRFIGRRQSPSHPSNVVESMFLPMNNPSLETALGLVWNQSGEHEAFKLGGAVYCRIRRFHDWALIWVCPFQGCIQKTTSLVFLLIASLENMWTSLSLFSYNQFSWRKYWIWRLEKKFQKNCS